MTRSKVPRCRHRQNQKKTKSRAEAGKVSRPTGAEYNNNIIKIKEIEEEAYHISYTGGYSLMVLAMQQ